MPLPWPCNRWAQPMYIIIFHQYMEAKKSTQTGMAAAPATQAQTVWLVTQRQLTRQRTTDATEINKQL